MINKTKSNKRISFSKLKLKTQYPDFLNIQLDSFRNFFQFETRAERKNEEGLFKVFNDNFPISDSRNLFTLEFLDYFIDPPKFSIQECIARGITYSVPLKAKLKLYTNDEEYEDFETQIKDVFLGNIPYMTPKGSFIINGAERVVVSQLHRSPGVFFGHSTHTNGTKLYSARIIPFKGSWIDFTTDINNVIYAYIDRKKKLPVTTLLRAIGFETDKDILEIFGLSNEVEVNKKNSDALIGKKLAARVLKSWSEDFVDEDTGEVSSIERTKILYERDSIIDEDILDDLIEENIKAVILNEEDENAFSFNFIYNTLQKDTTNTEKEAVEYIYRQLRNSEPHDFETAKSVLNKLFFSESRYDLGEVGRFKLNKKLSLDIDPNQRVLTNEDINSIIKYLIKLANDKIEVDDIDHLSNRRVRTVGEQLYNQFDLGLARMTRTIKDRMNVRDNELFTITELVNSKALTSVLNTFFGTNQLSQFMDQTNPLAEVTHKRRLSALGPGGLSRERAGFEVRDVHYTHYGRLCTIETPEGPNIGLISSLAVYSKVNKYGFLETPYWKLNKKGESASVNIKAGPEFIAAEEEEGKIIAALNSSISEKGEFETSVYKARFERDYPETDPLNIDLLDVGANQIASIAASMIPFLEHNDANRALMGSNMQRQALPLMRPKAPIVGTGIEKQLAQDSRVLVNAEMDGEVIYVDANKIIIRHDRTELDRIISFEDDEKSYELSKFLKTNQGTNVNLKPIVKVGDRVQKNQVLCEGFSTENGEIALGQNLQVAFMPWKGYNFEDAIVISERVVREDIFTSIHIDEKIAYVRETKRGNEEFTSDIPNVSEEATKDLDEHGIVRIGKKIKNGDILVGKITPKGESDPTPEEKLLRAIFGDKAGDVKDASMRASHADTGFIINKSIYIRKVKDKKEKKSDTSLLNEVDAEFDKDHAKLKEILVEKLVLLIGEATSAGIKDNFGEILIKKGKKITNKDLLSLRFSATSSTINENQFDIKIVDAYNWTSDEEMNNNIVHLIHNYKIRLGDLYGNFKRKQFKITIGDELPAGIVKLAKVYIAKKRKLKVGDKMAGRHGNKGIVAKIVRDEDMPFLEDGTPMDIVLNPLGVPSRMNLGQIFETVLGWAGKKLDLKFTTPIFDGATLDEINVYTDEAGIPRYGHTYLYNGETGERFHQKATVGVIYMLKLSHMVDDKMHARSIGPYSLITQQPLGGKAQFGGQRFGEMEVWALEAFGAANILREILTIKSDDIEGRTKTYEAIVKGEQLPSYGIPESFNVLLHELNGLGLTINLDS